MPPVCIVSGDMVAGRLVFIYSVSTLEVVLSLLKFK
jgi:hypothetical protein